MIANKILIILTLKNTTVSSVTGIINNILYAIDVFGKQFKSKIKLSILIAVFFFYFFFISVKSLVKLVIMKIN